MTRKTLTVPLAAMLLAATPGMAFAWGGGVAVVAATAAAASRPTRR